MPILLSSWIRDEYTELESITYNFLVQVGGRLCLGGRSKLYVAEPPMGVVLQRGESNRDDVPKLQMISFLA